MNLLPKSWCVKQESVEQIEPVIKYISRLTYKGLYGNGVGWYYGAKNGKTEWGDKPFGQVLTIDEFKSLSKELTKGDLIEVSDDKDTWTKARFHSYDEGLRQPYIISAYGIAVSYTYARPVLKRFDVSIIINGKTYFERKGATAEDLAKDLQSEIQKFQEE